MDKTHLRRKQLQTIALGLAAGVAAALYPAWRMSQRTLPAALRYE